MWDQEAHKIISTAPERWKAKTKVNRWSQKVKKEFEVPKTKTTGHQKPEWEINQTGFDADDQEIIRGFRLESESEWNLHYKSILFLEQYFKNQLKIQTLY